MRRRELILAVAGAAAWPFAARAQQPGKMRRIGVQMGTQASSRDGQLQVGALRERLQQLGWVDGRNVQFDYRWLQGEAGEARRLAKDLIALQPDVLVTHGIPNSVAVLQETQTIPLVFVNVADPVNLGLAKSFANPGGNATGFMNMDPSMGGKWVQVLKQFLPNIRRVGFMFNPDTAAAHGRYYTPSFEAGAAALGVEPMLTPVHSPAEIETVIAELAGQPDDGMIVAPDLFLAAHRPLIIELAARYRVPTIYISRLHAETGGLISYGSDSIDIFGRAASYVDRILKGEKPGNLPVQSPTKFELIINLKTAKALGLTVNREFLVRADDVIE
jgi:putative tryptophan/tyrosine transport system substrate-binding protein